ncbi:MAG: hypothetical protein U5L75_03490 [Candidatus Campbellbacteria bacterium]|nr:hypothetical protein [Candidatus Campbellbacteria bacterium]
MKKRLNAGITIMELLIYIGIMTLALVSIVSLLINATDIITAVKQDKEIRSSAFTALDRIGREVKGATEIVKAESSFDSDPGVLTINAVDENGDQYEATFEVSGDDLNISYDDTVLGSLISEDVTVESLTFYLSETATSRSVRTELTLSHLDDPSKQKTFYLTTVPRGMY